MLSRRGRLIGFDVDGHAGYAEAGSDIVCSAVSALAQTALLGLQERLQLPVSCEMKEGNMRCVLGEGIPETQWEQAEIVLDTLLLGLTSMQSGYGEYMSVTQREV